MQLSKQNSFKQILTYLLHTDAKHDKKTNFVHCCEFVAVEIIGCVRPAQLVRWLDAGHACVKGLWNYQQLEHINQWESRDQRESPSFPFRLLLPFAWFSTKHDWTHWRKKMLHKFTIWLWFDVNVQQAERKSWRLFKVRFLYWRLEVKSRKLEIIDLIEDAILDWTFGQGSGSKWNYYLLNRENLENTL